MSGKFVVIFVSTIFVLLLAGCGGAAPAAPAAPAAASAAPAAEAPAAAPESQISWNPAACEFPTGSGVEPLELTHLEVTQGVQTPDNDLPLIVGRSTAVLAHINTVISATLSLTGTMTVTDASGNTVAILAASAKMLAEGSSSDRSYVVLVFEPFRISNPQPVSVSVDVQADIGGNLVVTTASLARIPVLATVQPSFYFSLINFWPRQYLIETSGRDFPPFIELARSPFGDALMRGVMPADDESGWFYEHFQDIGWGEYTDEGAIITHEYSCELFKALSTMRETIVTPFVRPFEDAPIAVGSIETKFLYGWVYAPTCAEEDSNVVEENGNASVGGRVAYGSTTPCKGQQTYVHETLHNLYVTHDSQSIDACGWDVGLHLEPQPWSSSASTEQRKPRKFSRIMGHNSTDVSWAASEEYIDAMAYVGSTKLSDFMQTLPDCSTGMLPCIEQGQYIFQGCLANQLFPDAVFNTFQNPWYSQRTPYTIGDPSQLPYRLVFRSNGSPLATIPFDARMATNPEDGSEGIYDKGFFNVAVPEAIVLEADEIVIRGVGIEEIPFRIRTEPPKIKSLEITKNDGEGRLSAFVEVEDVDTEMLACQFSFSPDDGRNWFPLEATRGLNRDDLVHRPV
jgi:hypothetical protein